MKRHFLILGLIAYVFTLTDCTKAIEKPQNALGVDNVVPFEIVASTVETKTTNYGLSTKWEAGDEMSVVSAESGNPNDYSTNNCFVIEEENLSDNRFTGELTGLAADKSYDWYMMYPRNEDWIPNSTSQGGVYIGSRHDLVQTQVENNSKAHLAGTYFPLYGKVEGVSAGMTPSVVMSHLASVVAITVHNEMASQLTVAKITFTAPEDIIGQFYIAIDGETPVYTPKNGYVTDTAILRVSGSASIAQNKSATFYIGIKPFTAKAGEAIKISVNGNEKTLTLQEEVSFEAGHIKPITFNY